MLVCHSILVKTYASCEYILPEVKSKYSLVKIVVKIFIKINRSKNVSSSAKTLRLSLPEKQRNKIVLKRKIEEIL